MIDIDLIDCPIRDPEFEPKISTLRGMTIDRNEEYEKANDSIRFIFEFCSNEIRDSDQYDEKQDE
jgi:hypothetical protein